MKELKRVKQGRKEVVGLLPTSQLRRSLKGGGVNLVEALSDLDVVPSGKDGVYVSGDGVEMHMAPLPHNKYQFKKTDVDTHIFELNAPISTESLALARDLEEYTGATVMSQLPISDVKVPCKVFRGGVWSTTNLFKLV